MPRSVQSLLRALIHSIPSIKSSVQAAFCGSRHSAHVWLMRWACRTAVATISRSLWYCASIIESMVIPTAHLDLVRFIACRRRLVGGTTTIASGIQVARHRSARRYVMMTNRQRGATRRPRHGAWRIPPSCPLILGRGSAHSAFLRSNRSAWRCRARSSPARASSSSWLCHARSKSLTGIPPPARLPPLTRPNVVMIPFACIIIAFLWRL